MNKKLRRWINKLILKMYKFAWFNLMDHTAHYTDDEMKLIIEYAENSTDIDDVAAWIKSGEFQFGGFAVDIFNDSDTEIFSQGGTVSNYFFEYKRGHDNVLC